VRVALVLVALLLIGIFTIAICLNPYREDGTPLRLETHRKLGLPSCTFKEVTGLPCPSCGMTTSFALLVRGDVFNSLMANAVGTLMALYCLVIIPWNLVCAIRGRLYWIESLERAMTSSVIFFLVLMLLRWAVVLGLEWLG
jgi:hypothetical protein